MSTQAETPVDKQEATFGEIIRALVHSLPDPEVNPAGYAAGMQTIKGVADMAVETVAMPSLRRNWIPLEFTKPESEDPWETIITEWLQDFPGKEVGPLTLLVDVLKLNPGEISIASRHRLDRVMNKLGCIKHKFRHKDKGGEYLYLRGATTTIQASGDMDFIKSYDPNTRFMPLIPGEKCPECGGGALSDHLREYASNPGYSHGDYADAMRKAADELDRLYRLNSLLGNSDLETAIKNIRAHTDGHSWYWLSCGEKDYAFACVSAFPLSNEAPYPKGGTRLIPHPEKASLWLAEDGTEMISDESIAVIERQNGDVICQFIAIAHTALVGGDNV